MDIFYEYMVKRKKTGVDKLYVAGIALAAVLVTFIMLFCMMLFGTSGLGGVFLLLIVGAWYGAVYLVKRRNIEFEYILTNGTLDIDKIMARASRKRIISLNLREIEACCPANDGRNFAANGGNDRKVFDLSGNIADENVYFIDTIKDGQKIRVFFQPNKNILSGIKQANPRQTTLREADVV